MKQLLKMNNKYKAVCIVAFIIVMILLKNLAERQSFSNLDHSISSIYQDRLLPSNYLFEISHHLYEKRLAYRNGTATEQEIQGHNRAVAGIVKKYEATFLTPDEKQQWGKFKQYLHHYNMAEKKADIKALDDHFRLTMAALNGLSQLQVGEGQHLQQNSQGIVSRNKMVSHLEMSLLIILGATAVVLLGFSEHPLLPGQQRHLLN